MSKVFLGGTCNESTWREELIKMLTIGYFNPVVKDWTPECQQEEIKQRKECGFCLYVLTPRMKGVYTIYEIAEDSIKNPAKTILCILDSDVDDDGNQISFSESQLKSLEQIANRVRENSVPVFYTLQETAAYLNNKSDAKFVVM